DVVWLAIVAIVGALSLTVSWKIEVVASRPSLTVTLMMLVPNWPAAGVTVTVRFAPLPPNAMPAFGTSVVFDELPLTVRLAAGVSASPTVNAIAPVAVPPIVDWLAIAEIVGGVLVALTVSRNPVLVESTPSPTVTVIVAEPVCPAAGVTVTVRFAPLPPNAMFALGTSVRFDDAPLSESVSTGVSTSATLKAIGPAAIPLIVT